MSAADEAKKRVQLAMEKFSAKQLPKQKRTIKNGKPEAELVLELKKHLEGLGFSINVIEAKAVYSERAGRYLRGQAAAGLSDLVGNTHLGQSVFIEAKAPGRRNTIRLAQHKFLTEKIRSGCFAIVCDSIEYFNIVWAKYTARNGDLAKMYLLSELPLPPKKYRDDEFKLE